ncbi:MAG: tetratricopeptide repeat protein [Candidatus Omnitrophota bacterium]
MERQRSPFVDFRKAGAPISPYRPIAGLLSLTLFLAISAIPSFASSSDGKASPAPSPGHLSETELKIWNDPAFQKQFAESYMAETEIEPRVTVPERDQMQKALALIASDKMDEAAALLEKSRNEAASAVFDFTAANIYFQQDKLDQALAAYQAAIGKYPKFRRAWKNLGIIYIRKGEYEKSLPALTRAIELGDNSAISYGLLGFAYSSVENYLSAESAYRMAILLDPNTLDWKMGLARSFFKQERYSEAVSICKQLIKDRPERTDLWLLQANAFIGLNQPVKAAEIYELVDRLGGSTVESLSMLGDIYINEELYDMAVNAYKRAMEKNPQDKPDHALRSAKVLAGRGALAETRQIVEQIESLYGDRLQANDRKDLLKIRARLAVAEGSGKEEVRVLEEIVALDPLDGEALILLGQNSSRNGDNEKAFFYYERAASIETFEADAKVRHAQLLVGEGKYEEALPLLQRAQQINPRDNIQKYLEQVERVSKTR